MNDARLSLHQPVRYQIVFTSCQPGFSDEIRLHFLYSLLIMWNVTVGPKTPIGRTRYSENPEITV